MQVKNSGAMYERKWSIFWVWFISHSSNFYLHVFSCKCPHFISLTKKFRYAYIKYFLYLLKCSTTFRLVTGVAILPGCTITYVSFIISTARGPIDCTGLSTVTQEKKFFLLLRIPLAFPIFSVTVLSLKCFL